MNPGVLIITGDPQKYGSGHDTRMRLVALELRKRKIDVQKMTLTPEEIVDAPLPFRVAVLDRRDTPFNPPLPDLAVTKVAIDNRGPGREAADLIIDLLPHPEMNKHEYSLALQNIILPPSLTAEPSKAPLAQITLHNSPAEAFAAADFTPPKDRASAESFLRALSASTRPALYFGQALFEALYLGLHVQLYPVSDYHKKLAVDLFSRRLIEPELLHALDGKGLARCADLIQKILKQANTHD